MADVRRLIAGVADIYGVMDWNLTLTQITNSGDNSSYFYWRGYFIDDDEAILTCMGIFVLRVFSTITQNQAIAAQAYGEWQGLKFIHSAEGPD